MSVGSKCQRPADHPLTADGLAVLTATPATSLGSAIREKGHDVVLSLEEVGGAVKEMSGPGSPGVENALEAFKVGLSSKRSFNQLWGRRHNVGFHLVLVLGAVVAVFAIMSDFWGVRGVSMIGLAGGALIATPSALKMKEKSFWYFEYASQLEAILSRLGAETLNHSQAVEEYVRLDAAMTAAWEEVTRSIDIRPIVEAAKERVKKSAGS